ncbi:hypothetical protein XBKQ1_2910003 [Xenorhabdus bovienii str. kraussei Quebec]|uniref:Uncharacterized protein n=1 Tax=Xenorhabdus bovienii str. kraussei Quebec TaxID=1398203 RepID=A0A077PJC5_XENBV|nr:hypothetical protein XBKQ1_2910003 [Xenorhabdus bovienii str. kraussei Quebec]
MNWRQPIYANYLVVPLPILLKSENKLQLPLNFSSWLCFLESRA